MEHPDNDVETVISMRPNSVVVKLNGFVDKSYRPQDFEAWRERYGETVNYGSRSFETDQRSFFNHEFAVIRAFSNLNPGVLPPYVKGDKPNLRIRFEYSNLPVYQQCFEEIWSDERSTDEEKVSKVNSLTEEMMRVAVFPFYDNTNSDPRALGVATRIGSDQKAMLRLRSNEYRQGKINQHFKGIFYATSSELERYWEEKGINPDRLTLEQVRTHIKKFGKRYNLAERIRKIEERDRRLTFHRESCINGGDVSPQNIFRTRDPNDVQMFDLDKSRKGSRNIDMYTSINNIHRFPFHPDQEAISLELAAEHYRRTGIPEELLPVRMAGYIGSTQVLGTLRMWATYCQMVSDDLRSFLGDRPEFRGLENGDLRSKVIHDFLPNSMMALTDYYRFRRGEGWEVAIEKPLLSIHGLDQPERRKHEEILADIRDQIREVENILTEVGSLHGKPTSQARAKKIRRIFALS
jgi:hypothetical protein